jgi:proline iminopeptidase
MALRTVAVLAFAGLAACRAEAPDSSDGPIPVSEHFTTTPDSVRLYYRVAGDSGPTVLAPFALFHGNSFDSLATEFRIVTYDPRGRGQSDPVTSGKVSLNHLLLDLETVRQAVGAEQVAIIGWSGGGMETFVYALRNPNRVTRLVQLTPVAPRFVPYGGLMLADRRARTDSAAAANFNARLRTGAFGADSAALCRASDSVTTPPLLANPTSPPPIPDPCRFPNEYTGRLGAYFAALFSSIDGYNWLDSLSAVPIPRLVLHGARDNIPLAGSEEWVAGQPNARILVIDNAGHFPHYEQPRETLSAISTFLRGSWPDRAIAR